MELDVITIDVERCTGCGACVEACPSGALYLVEGRAQVDGALCRESEACLEACPSGAINLVAQAEPVAEPVQVPALRPEGHGQPEPEVIQVRTIPAPVPLRSRALPVVGAALAWAGREIVPLLADLVLDTLDRQATGKRMTARGCSNGDPSEGTRGRGRQRRHRRRGGGGSR